MLITIKMKETIKDLTVKEYNTKINGLAKAYEALCAAGCINEALIIKDKLNFTFEARNEYLNNIK